MNEQKVLARNIRTFLEGQYQELPDQDLLSSPEVLKTVCEKVCKVVLGINRSDIENEIEAPEYLSKSLSELVLIRYM